MENTLITENNMDLEAKYELVRSIGEECINEDELKKLLEHKELPVAYDGFEPSGRMHIAQGLIRSINVNKLLKEVNEILKTTNEINYDFGM